MKKHYVTFYSPGTLFHEQNIEEVDFWNVDLAVLKSKDIKQRHGAIPFGFRFTTREKGSEDFDSKQSDSSQMYYLGGKVETLDEVRERNDPKESILLSNMENNGYDRIITCTRGYKSTHPLNKEDIVLDMSKYE